MSLVAAWLLFPLILLLLAVGCGLLAERAAGIHLPGALVPAVGLALVIVVGQFLTLVDATAELTTPVVVALAVIGLGLAGRDALRRADPWAGVAAAAAFAAFAAPIVLSGDATFAGYIKLDDTATWMTLTDHVMEAGRSLEGLAPSTYEATLAFNLGDGYPMGVFLPLGAATLLSGQDVAWTIQPYMAFLGALLALGLWQLAAPVVGSRPLRALIAFAGSQSALLYGYYLWGGVKELAAAALLATAVALTAFAIARRGAVRTIVPLATVCAAVIGVLSAGGALWLAVPLAGGLVLLALQAGAAQALRSGALCAGVVALLSAPVLLTGGLLPPTSSPLTAADAQGNLITPLDPAQAAGVWASGDFRLAPEDPMPTGILVALFLAAAACGVVWSVRSRSWGAPLYVGGTLVAALVIYAIGSPWVDGKALATASPAIPFAAALAAAALWLGGRRVEGGVLMVAVAGGILWSNALQYRDVNLAPRDQLAELEEIGESIAGEGPALMTEYQPYGARHFLRDAQPEAASELRRREVPLERGGPLEKGLYADTDRFALEGLMVYRTLVLRRGPDQSRPPAPYRLVERGEFYEVWQRSQPPSLEVIRHLGLGNEVNPVGVPDCSDVSELAELAGPEGELVAAGRPAVIVASLARADYPADWSESVGAATPVPAGPGTLTTTVDVPRSGEFEVWLRGSVRPRVELLVDGRAVGELRHQLQNAGLYTLLGAARIEEGSHEVSVRFHGPDLHPGSGGAARPIGPLVLSDSDAAEASLSTVSAAIAAERLCGREWDWIEAVR